MSQDTSIYADFLREMRDLEEFRLRYTRRQPTVALDSDDPDVRRILEAMAYFSVQTQRAAKRNLHATWHRLFTSYFGDLIKPLPSRGLVQAVVTEKMAEPRVLPRGSEVRITTEDGSTGTLHTLCELHVLPLKLERTAVLVRPQGNFLLVVSFRSPVPRRDLVERLHLHVRHLDDYLHSLDALYRLRVHLQRAFVVYDQPVNEASEGDPCRVSFGAWRDEEAHWGGPIERVRRFFHHPEDALFVHIDVPPCNGEWSRVALCFELDSRWPGGRARRFDVFQPFTVPVENIHRDTAEPILCDGAQSSYPILDGSSERARVLHSVTGVYEITKRGLNPLRAGALPDQGTPGAAFEIDESLEPGGTPRLLLRMPEAFAEPRRIAVEGNWYEPKLSPRLAGPLAVTLPGRHLEGVVWRIVGGMRPHQDNPLRHDTDGLLHVLSLKMKPMLGREEIQSLLSLLGSLHEGSYRQLPEMIKETDFEVRPDPGREGGNVRHIYRLKMDRFPPEHEALVWSFLLHVRELLDAWNPEARVELEIDAGGSVVTLPLNEGLSPRFVDAHTR